MLTTEFFAVHPLVSIVSFCSFFIEIACFHKKIKYTEQVRRKWKMDREFDKNGQSWMQMDEVRFILALITYNYLSRIFKELCLLDECG